MEYSGRLRLLTIVEKRVFRTLEIWLSKIITSPSSANVLFALNGVLSESSPEFLVICDAFCV